MNRVNYHGILFQFPMTNCGGYFAEIELKQGLLSHFEDT